MNDYISREETLDAIHAWSPKEPWDKFDKQVAFAIVHALPAADAALRPKWTEIVRCKGCRYFDQTDEHATEYTGRCGWFYEGTGIKYGVGYNDFCSNAERKSDDKK